MRTRSTEHRAGSKIGRQGSVLAIRAAGAKSDSKVGETQTEAGENHQEHERIADAHVQWQPDQSQ
jgi:hypothetical protein